MCHVYNVYVPIPVLSAHIYNYTYWKLIDQNTS